MISFGLTSKDLETRANSIGASDTRIIVNGTDEQIELLWRLKRGEIDRPDLDSEIYCQFGQFVEAFHRHWFEMRTGLEINCVSDEITSPDYPGLHVTLDGFLEEMPPVVFADPGGDFKHSWGCDKPRGPIAGPLELKWRNARQFNADEQVATFLPQLHQGMAITGAEFATLSTLTSDLVIYARVVRFDQFYWADCLARIEDFREAVETGRAPRKWRKIGAASGAAEVKSIMRSNVDMAKGPKANMWLAFAQMMLSNAPSSSDLARDKAFEQAKTQLKALLDKDVASAFGGGVTAKRNKAGAVSFEIDESKLAEARADADARSASGLA